MPSPLKAVYFPLIILSCLVIASTHAFPEGHCADDQFNARKVLWQRIPVTAVAEINGKVIDLEVAGTPEQRAIGLMHRPCLPKDRGMLFVYNPPEQVYYWMKNVLIPLDMVFIAGGRVKTIYRNLPPCLSDDCPHYISSSDIDLVLELNAGLSDELSLKENDSVIIRHRARQ